MNNLIEQILTEPEKAIIPADEQTLKETLITLMKEKVNDETIGNACIYLRRLPDKVALRAMRVYLVANEKIPMVEELLTWLVDYREKAFAISDDALALWDK